MPERPPASGATPSEAFPPERLSDVLERAPAIVWLWDAETGCTYVSEAWTRILDREPAEAWGEGWADSVHPEDREAFDACRSAMRRNEPYAAEYRLRRGRRHVRDGQRPGLRARARRGRRGRSSAPRSR